jgi:hypothetical protein
MDQQVMDKLSPKKNVKDAAAKDAAAKDAAAKDADAKDAAAKISAIAGPTSVSKGKEEVLKRVAARKAAKAAGAVSVTKKMEVLAKARRQAEEKAKARKEAEEKLQQQVADKVIATKEAAAKTEAEEKEKKRADVRSRIAARKNKSAALGGTTPTANTAAVPKTPLTPGVPAFDPAPATSPGNGVGVAIGDHVKITKDGSQKGYTGVVTDPSWTGRVKLRMDADSSIKSYLLEELEVLGKAPPMTMAAAAALERERARLADEKDHRSGDRHSRGARTRGAVGESLFWQCMLACAALCSQYPFSTLVSSRSVSWPKGANQRAESGCRL